MSRFFACLGLCVALAGCDALNEPTDQGASARSQVQPVAVFGTQSWAEVAAGNRHTCALDVTGAAWCWGANTYNQIGVITPTTCPDVGPCARRPLEVSGGHRFVKLAAGATHNCGLKANGEVWCWGGGTETGNAGYLGGGSIVRTLEPVKVTADSAFVEIAVGAGNSCALTASGEAWCWGKNANGELGDSSRTARLVPAKVRSTAALTRITMGLGHSCALTDNGTAQCWGTNRFGQLGIADVSFDVAEARALIPTRVQSTGAYSDIRAGDNFTCALRTTGGIECWGINADAGQLGDSLRLTHRGVPGPIASTASFTAFDAGSFTACARTSEGVARCWGGNVYGAIGNGTRSILPEQFPVALVGSVTSFVRFSGGGQHMCGISAAQRLYCWGDRAYGQIGN